MNRQKIEIVEASVSHHADVMVSFITLLLH